MNENRPIREPRRPIVAGDMICFVVGNKLGSAGVSIKLSEKGSVKQTNSGLTGLLTISLHNYLFALKEPSPIFSTFFQTFGDFAITRKLIFFS